MFSYMVRFYPSSTLCEDFLIAPYSFNTQKLCPAQEISASDLLRSQKRSFIDQMNEGLLLDAQEN